MYALINGYVFRDPERKTAKSGIDYAKASIKEGRGDETIFVSVTAFRDCADALMQARDGDAISVMGELKLRAYEKDGQPKAAADIMANCSQNPPDKAARQYSGAIRGHHTMSGIDEETVRLPN